MITPTADSAVLGRVYDDVLRPNFPEAELVDRESFLSAARRGELEVLVSADGPDLLGAIVGQRHGSAVLVVWLAVGSRGRGGGVGSTLLRAGVVRWLDRPGVVMVLAEVERPDVFPVHPVHGDPKRRLAFYARSAAGVLDIPYFQPSAGQGLPPVHGLLLTVLGTKNASPAPRLLDAAEADALRAYLDDVHGDDDEAASVIAAATAPGGVRLLPLTDYAATPLSGGLSPRS